MRSYSRGIPPEQTLPRNPAYLKFFRWKLELGVLFCCSLMFFGFGWFCAFFRPKCEDAPTRAQFLRQNFQEALSGGSIWCQNVSKLHARALCLSLNLRTLCAPAQLNMEIWKLQARELNLLGCSCESSTNYSDTSIEMRVHNACCNDPHSLPLLQTW